MFLSKNPGSTHLQNLCLEVSECLWSGKCERGVREGAGIELFLYARRFLLFKLYVRGGKGRHLSDLNKNRFSACSLSGWSAMAVR